MANMKKIVIWILGVGFIIAVLIIVDTFVPQFLRPIGAEQPIPPPDPPPIGPQPLFPVDIQGQVGFPTLTEEERAKVIELLNNDPKIQAILGGYKYEVSLIGVWYEDGQKIGVFADLLLEKPVNFEGELPYYIEEERSPELPYQVKSTYTKVKGLSELHIRIDLNKNEVVSILPLEVEEIELRGITRDLNNPKWHD